MRPRSAKSRTLFALLVLFAAVTRAEDEQHPESLVGRWQSELDGSVMLLNATGSMKMYEGDTPKDNPLLTGYWEVRPRETLVIKPKGKDLQERTYVVKDSVLRLRTPEGDTYVLRKLRSPTREEIVGEWLLVKSEARKESVEDGFALNSDGTYDFKGINQTSDRTVFGWGGRWTWQDTGSITLINPNGPPVTVKVVGNRDSIKLVTENGKVFELRRPSATKVATAPGLPPHSTEDKRSTSSSSNDAAAVPDLPPHSTENKRSTSPSSNDAAAMRRVRASRLQEEAVVCMNRAQQKAKWDRRTAEVDLRVLLHEVATSDDLEDAVRDRLRVKIELLIRSLVSPEAANK